MNSEHILLARGYLNDFHRTKSRKKIIKLQDENKRLREGYTALFKEIRSRFAKDDEVGYESMSKELREIMLESRKLLNL